MMPKDGRGLLRTLRQVSIAKTLRFNLHYFGFGGCPVLIARNYRLERLGGKVIVDEQQVFGVRLGFHYVGILDWRAERGIWDVDGWCTSMAMRPLGLGSASA